MVIGHQKILDFFDQSIKNNKISHSYLLVGPQSVGKFKVAGELAKKLSGGVIDTIENHPDISVINQDSTIKIEQIRDLIHYLCLSPYNLKYKIAIINNIEQLSVEAANSILKTLEEPTPNSILILIANELNKVLPTIISRCQIIRFSLVKELGLERGLTQLLSFAPSKEILALAAGRPGIAIKLATDSELLEQKKNNFNNIKLMVSKDASDRLGAAKQIIEKENIEDLLVDWLLNFREELMFKLGILKESSLQSNFSIKNLGRILREIIITDNLNKNTNVNNLLAIENLILRF